MDVGNTSRDFYNQRQALAVAKGREGPMNALQGERMKRILGEGRNKTAIEVANIRAAQADRASQLKAFANDPDLLDQFLQKNGL
jgi:hypothetical protein